MTLQESNKNRDISQDILRAVEDLRLGTGFGSVEIIVHEGRITQIEKREKLRLPLEKIKYVPTAPAAAK